MAWSASGLVASILAASVLAGVVSAADVDAPVDVPDDIGLGERLALVAWLKDHGIPIADPADVAALRLAYLRVAHPEQVAAHATADADADQQRGDLAAELYRKHGKNAPAEATAAEIRALIAVLDTAQRTALARDQAAAHEDGVPRSRDRGEPAVATAANAPEAHADPHTPPASDALTPAAPPTAQQQARAALGIEIGKPFPELSGRTVDGSAFELRQWAGKVVLVDVWATWCGPCLREMPTVAAAYAAYHARGFEIIGVSLDSDLPKLKKYLADQPIAWPQIFDGDGWNGRWAKKLGIHAIPCGFLVGPDGALITTDVRGGNLESALKKALVTDP
ncbi:MAG: TlpA family protein disulfide reductase [Planctomycetes bacterium]|nr:TlpA family protein disulfide reductase [Planctomycetota bacterium]